MGRRYRVKAAYGNRAMVGALTDGSMKATSEGDRATLGELRRGTTWLVLHGRFLPSLRAERVVSTRGF